MCVVIDDHKCGNCGVAMRFSPGGVAYFKSTAITGTKKDPKFIAKQAAGPFECGEVFSGLSSRPPACLPAPLRPLAVTLIVGLPCFWRLHVCHLLSTILIHAAPSRPARSRCASIRNLSRGNLRRESESGRMSERASGGRVG